MSARSAASNGKNPDVAFLVFGPLRERRKNNSFEFDELVEWGFDEKELTGQEPVLVEGE